jgi:hypothetical protein
VDVRIGPSSMDDGVGLNSSDALTIRTVWVETCLKSDSDKDLDDRWT